MTESLWFFSTIPAILIFSVLPVVIIGVAMYFIIKLAVKNALREYDKEKKNL